MASIKLKGTITTQHRQLCAADRSSVRTHQIDLTIEIPNKVIGGYFATISSGSLGMERAQQITMWLGKESDDETT